jgi:molybdenum cofactor biosynthesis protein MoaC
MTKELLGKFKMIGVAHKPETLRFARSEGWIKMSQKAFQALQNGTNPKGDVLAMAEVAGLMALKKTSDILPLCHPLAIQRAELRFELIDDCKVRAECIVEVIGRTGAEMESLMGLQGALLCIYDLSKAVDPLIEMGGLRLLEKKGGKSGHWFNPLVPNKGEKLPSKKGQVAWSDMRVSVVTLSDRASEGIYEDKSGPLLKKIFEDWGVHNIGYHLIPDDSSKLAELLKVLSKENFDLVICNGGTGFSPRDQTPECLLAVCDRMIPGFGELLRSSGSIYTPLSYLSRSQAGLLGQTIVVSLSGSPKAIEEGMGALKYVLPTGVLVARGGNPHESPKGISV